MGLISFFNLLGFSTLLRNTVKDVRIKEIDSRFNFIMYGATYMLIGYSSTPFKLIFGLILFSFFLSKGMGKGGLASGDVEALNWLILSSGVISWVRLFVFLVCLSVLLLGYNLVIRFSGKKRLPGYPMLLSAFLISAQFR